jgi:hypothetical protein
MGFSIEGVVSIIELVVYIPCLMAACIVCSPRIPPQLGVDLHPHPLPGRIIGAACQLVSYTNNDPSLIKPL